MKFSNQVLGAIARELKFAKVPDFTQKEVVIRNFTFMYHTMKASEHMLEVAVECSKERPDLCTYFKEHLEEERGHHLWLASDLNSAGVDVAKTGIPVRAVEMVGTQYYLMYHVDPAALLGYMALQECFSRPLEVIDQLEKMHGKELFRTARYHAEHDIDHGADIANVLDKLPETSQSIVLENAIQTARYFCAATQNF
ncbi:hypothetical protein LE191_04220 [Janthinobacterium sp. HSC-3S05]|uniref:hypothetical protein n=1 Tax=Janthinobacterium lividum TaxID=29581 RepID=UPI001CD8A074|nr:hypothetical protein [Janthinobacterium lividum]MCA1859315.1 hypothetical protein [Janthinobacterium lividum]MCL6483322.1 hypothetical protein [Janthinobacterium lividum]